MVLEQEYLMKQRQRVGSILALSSILSVLYGCSATIQGNSTDSQSNEISKEAGVDPRILRDVIDSQIPVPGPRAQFLGLYLNKLNHLVHEECATDAPAPLGSTESRIDQARYADLALIREKGLSEITLVEDGKNNPDTDRGEPSEAEKARLTAKGEKEGDCARKILGSPGGSLLQLWSSEVVETAHASTSMSDVKQKTAACLAERTPVSPSIDDPTGDFLPRLDGYLSYLPTLDKLKEEGLKFSNIYADCTEDYFSQLAELLEQERPKFIEKHREVLIVEAKGLAKAGYTP